MSDPEYKAMLWVIALGLFIVVTASVYIVARMARPSGWQEQTWVDVSDGRVK
jgi:hypothetical protein